MTLGGSTKSRISFRHRQPLALPSEVKVKRSECHPSICLLVKVKRSECHPSICLLEQVVTHVDVLSTPDVQFFRSCTPLTKSCETPSFFVVALGVSLG